MLKAKERRKIQFLRRDGNSIRRISRITQYDRNTIRNVLATLSLAATPTEVKSSRQAGVSRSGRRSSLEPFREFLLAEAKRKISTPKLMIELQSRGFDGSPWSFRRFLHANRLKIITRTEQLKEWMHLVLQGAKSSSQIKQDVGTTLTNDEVTTLLEYVRTKPLKLRNRALALLAHGKGITPGHIASFLCTNRQTARRYISDFKRGGVGCVLDLSRKEVKKVADPIYAAAVFKTQPFPSRHFWI